MSKVISARQEFGVAPSLGISEPAGTRTHGLGKYGRTLGDVILPDGTNVNHALVVGGDTQAVPPWEWRKARRGTPLTWPGPLATRGATQVYPTPGTAQPGKPDYRLRIRDAVRC